MDDCRQNCSPEVSVTNALREKLGQSSSTAAQQQELHGEASILRAHLAEKQNVIMSQDERHASISHELAVAQYDCMNERVECARLRAEGTPTVPSTLPMTSNVRVPNLGSNYVGFAFDGQTITRLFATPNDEKDSLAQQASRGFRDAGRAQISRNTQGGYNSLWADSTPPPGGEPDLRQEIWNLL
eukprot:4874088-Amphidinium_carterae.2